jgi:beta-glucosidase
MDAKRLRGFEKISLRAGESKQITFKVHVKELAFIETDNKKHLEQGEFKVMVGEVSTTFNVNKSIVF